LLQRANLFYGNLIETPLTTSSRTLPRKSMSKLTRALHSRKRQKYDDFLAEVNILKSMDPYERSKLGDALKEEKFSKGDYVIKEGEIGDKFFFISEGEAIASKTIEAGKAPAEVMAYKKGDYFGERALLTNEARAANILVTVSESPRLIRSL